MTLVISKPMHNAALHIGARADEYGLSEKQRYAVAQVAEGFVGICDEKAAYVGLRVIRQVYKKLGLMAPSDELSDDGFDDDDAR